MLGRADANVAPRGCNRGALRSTLVGVVRLQGPQHAERRDLARLGRLLEHRTVLAGIGVQLQGQLLDRILPQIDLTVLRHVRRIVVQLQVDLAIIRWRRVHGLNQVDLEPLVVVTEWVQFRALDLDRLKANMAKPVVVDLRNIYRPEDMAAAGFVYESIGRPPVQG